MAPRSSNLRAGGTAGGDQTGAGGWGAAASSSLLLEAFDRPDFSGFGFSAETWALGASRGAEPVSDPAVTRPCISATGCTLFILASHARHSASISMRAALDLRRGSRRGGSEKEASRRAGGGCQESTDSALGGRFGGDSDGATECAPRTGDDAASKAGTSQKLRFGSEGSCGSCCCGGCDSNPGS